MVYEAFNRCAPHTHTHTQIGLCFFIIVSVIPYLMRNPNFSLNQTNPKAGDL